MGFTEEPITPMKNLFGNNENNKLSFLDQIKLGKQPKTPMKKEEDNNNNNNNNVSITPMKTMSFLDELKLKKKVTE